MLKFGVWGIYRLEFLVLAFKEPLLLVLLLGVILGSFSSSVQADGKRLIAYSSVCHINFLGFVLFSGGRTRGVARLLLILSHGTSSSLLFWVVGTIYKKIGRRQISFLSCRIIISISIIMIFCCISFRNFGVPPTLGFWGEVFFLYSFLRVSSFYFFLSLFYLLIVCYFSVFLLIRVFRGNSGGKRLCFEESFLLCGLILLFYIPVLKVCF